MVKMLPMVLGSAPSPGLMLMSFAGELGLGPEEPKSATKPTRHQPLVGIQVFRSVVCSSIRNRNEHCFSVAAGQHTTLFLAKPNEKFSDLPRHPEVDAPELCLVCNKDNGDDDLALECDKVRLSYTTASHCLTTLRQVRPPLPSDLP